MEISQLPHEPSTPADFGRWKEWVQSCESLGQWPVLHQIAQDDRNVATSSWDPPRATPATSQGGAAASATTISAAFMLVPA